MKKIIALITLMTFQAYAVDVISKGIAFSANGSSMPATVLSSSSPAYQVVSPTGPTFANPCVPGSPPSTIPRINTSSTSSVLFKQQLQSGSHPQNVSITQLRFTFCYSVSGNTLAPVSIFPQFKNLNNGVTVTSASSAATVNGNYPIMAGPYASAEVIWNLSAGQINTADLNNIEFGYKLYNGLGPIFGNPAVIHVHKMLMWVTFVQTAQSAPQAATLTYQGGAPSYNSRTITVSQPLNNPTNNERTEIAVRCSNNVYVPIQTFGRFHASPSVVIFSMQVLNTVSYCGSQGGLNQGTSTMIRSKNLDTGATAFSNNVTLL